MKITLDLDVLPTVTAKENIERVNHTVMDNRRFTRNQIANGISISGKCVEYFLRNELAMTKVSTR